MSDTIVHDTASRLFGDLALPAVVNAAETGIWPSELWKAVEDAGFVDALAAGAQSHGDLSGIGDAAAILRAAGRHAVPLPLAETMLARWIVAGAGLAAPAGPLTLAPVDRGSRASLRREGKGWRLAFTGSGVPWAQLAAAIVVVGDGHAACIAPARADIRSGKSLAGEPRDDVSLDVTLEADAVAPVASGLDDVLLYRLGALTRCVLMAGALEGALTLAVQYANDRVQFGRPIGKFQAIQQQLSVLAENVAAAGVIASAAVDVVASRGDIGFAVAAAKSRVGEAAGKVAEIAHQVHGAIGFTHEHRLHHLTRRLWAWRDEFGVESEWSAELGRIAASRGADGLWPLLTEW
ncbi:MAG TPA: acyl-CoA dehydrogenase family protein [Stellaceae bacterium]|nr:acyl-CoA dehydrogenase family protein [Stellaceae bacterium]